MSPIYFYLYIKLVHCRRLLGLGTFSKFLIKQNCKLYEICEKTGTLNEFGQLGEVIPAPREMSTLSTTMPLFATQPTYFCVYL